MAADTPVSKPYEAQERGELEGRLSGFMRWAKFRWDRLSRDELEQLAALLERLTHAP